MKYLYRGLAVILGILVFIFLIIGAINYTYIEGVVNHNVKNYGFIGIFVLSFVLDFLPQYFSPHSILLGGYLFEFNFIFVLLLVSLGSFFGSITSFFLGRNIRREVVQSIVGKKQKQGAKKLINKQGKWFVALAAISPLPYLPLVLGSIDMDWNNFLIFGVVPRTIGFILLSLLLYYFI